MKLIHTLYLTALLLISNLSRGQWNIQTGYDFGFFTTDYQGNHLLSKEEDSHYTHRINGRFEYQSKNNFLVSLNTGINIHDVRHDLQTRKNTDFSGNSVVRHRTSIHHSTLQAYRLGLSIGYKFSINNISSIILSLNYDHFFMNKVTNKERKLLYYQLLFNFRC
jgi:hypothetical protein